MTNRIKAGSLVGVFWLFQLAIAHGQASGGSSVSLVSPNNNASFTVGTAIMLTAVDSDTNVPVVRVDFLQGTTLLGSTTSAPYSFTWTNAPAGVYSLTARATDTSGAVRTSAPVTVWVFAHGPEVVNYGDFGSTVGLVLQGDAATVTNALRLTSATTNQIGAAWISSKRFLLDGFEADFEFQIARAGTNHGDGFALVIQNNATPGLGNGGPGLGYDGVSNSLAIEFDTHQDASYGDLNANQISVHTRGTAANSANESAALYSASPFIQLADGAVHAVRVAYTNNYLDVFLDGNPSPVLSGFLLLNNRLSLDDGRAWVGFTATCSTNVEEHDILNWRFSSPGAAPAPSVSPTNQMVMVGGNVTFTASTTGLEPFTYQWQHDATDVVGATNTMLTLTNVQATDAGQYAVVVSNAVGRGTSEPAVLAVTTLGTNVWTFATTNATIHSTPAIAPDGTIYFGTTSSMGASVVQALKPGGRPRWAYPIGSSVASAPAVGSDGTIYVACVDDSLYALKPDGTKKWAFQTGGTLVTSPAVGSDGAIYIGSNDAKLYAINPDGSQRWVFTTGGAVVSSVAIGADGTIYFGSADHLLYALNPDGNQKWAFPTGGEIHSSPAIGSDGEVYVASYEGNLYALNPDGTLRWKFNSGSGSDTSPALGPDGTIYYGAGPNMYAISPAGSNLWFFHTGAVIHSSPAVTADGTIYVGSDDHNAYAVASNGARIWTVTTGGVLTGDSPTIGPDGTVYIGSGDGKLYALHGVSPLADSSWPEFRRDLRHTGSLPPAGPPRFVSQPASQTVAPGTNVTLAVDVIGALPLTYQWQRNGTNLSDGGNVSGTATPVLTLTNIQVGQGGSYAVVVANGAGTNVSQTAALQVVPGYVPPGTLRWFFPTHGIVYAAPAIGPDGTIYFGSTDTNFYAVNPDGSTKWTFKAGGAIRSSAAVGADGTVYFGAGDAKVYALGSDGKSRWTFGPADPAGACPALGLDGTIYVADSGHLYAISPSGATNWMFTLGSTYHSSPVVDSDGTIYVSSGHFDSARGYEAGDLYALNPDGSVKWHFTARGPFTAAPSIGADGTIYFGSFDNAGKLYALDRQGNEKWEFATGASIGDTAVLGPDGSIYVGNINRTFLGLNPGGTQRWSFATGSNSGGAPAAVGADGTIYVSVPDGDLYALSTNGVVRWSFSLGYINGATPAPPVIGADGVVYFAGLTNLYSVQGGGGPADSPWPLFQHDAQHTGRVPSSVRVPTAVLTNPTNGTTYAPGQDVALQARAFGGTGSITAVSFFSGTNLLGTVTNLPYSLTWSNLVSGFYTLTATAVDQAGRMGTSGPVRIVVNDAPVVSLTSPTNGAVYTEHDDIWLRAVATDGDGWVAQVNFYQGTNVIGTVTNQPYEVLLPNVVPGNYFFSAKATDNQGATGRSAAIATVVNDLPQVSLSSPTDHSQFNSGDAITLTATATDRDGSVARVDFYDGFTWLGTVTNSPFTLTVANLSPGDHALRSDAVDNLGALAMSPAITVLVLAPLPSPQLSFDMPFPNAVFVWPTPIQLSVTAADADGQVTQVQFYANQDLLATVGGSNTFAFSWTNAAPGNYLLTAHALDSRGASLAVARNVTVVDTNHLPVAPLLSAATPNTNFWVPDGPVNAIVETNGVVYIGGAFSHIGQSVPGNAVLELSSQTPDLSYPLVAGQIDAIADDGAGGYYLGGRFTAVGGIARINLAHVRADKTVDLDWAPSANGDVVTMSRLGNALYVGGNFTTVSGTPQAYLAALDATTGQILNWNPSVGGELTALVATNNAVYFGGFFDTVGIQTRNHFAAVDAATAALTSWDPNGDTYPLQLVAANGLIYAVGQFTTLSSQARSGLAALDPMTGHPTAWNPNPEGSVETLVAASNVVYLGGVFGRVEGVDRGNLAAVDANTGELLDWNPSAVGEVSTMALLGNTIYVAGTFQNIAGQARFRLAGLDRTSGQATSFDLNDTGRLFVLAQVGDKILGGGTVGLIQLPKQGLAAFDEATGAAISWDAQCDGQVRALAIKDNTLIVGGQFTTMGGQPRSSLGAIDLATARATLWNPDLVGGVGALAVSSNTVYVGGSFTAVGATARNNLAAVDATTAQALPWNPNPDGSVGTLGLASNLVYVAGDFSHIGGQARSHLAALNAFTGDAIDWNPAPNGSVLAIQVAKDLVYVGGYFQQIGGQPRTNLAAVDVSAGRASGWIANADGTVEALALGDQVLYAGGQFANIGGQPRVNLAALDLRLSPTNALAWNPAPTNPQQDAVVYALTLANSALYVGGKFQNVGATAQPYFAAFDLPAHVAFPLHLPDGLFRMNFVGPLGHYYIFEASTNLRDWIPVFTNRAPFVFEDLQSLDYPSRFYRAVPVN